MRYEYIKKSDEMLTSVDRKRTHGKEASKESTDHQCLYILSQGLTEMEEGIHSHRA